MRESERDGALVLHSLAGAAAVAAVAAAAAGTDWEVQRDSSARFSARYEELGSLASTGSVPNETECLLSRLWLGSLCPRVSTCSLVSSHLA